MATKLNKTLTRETAVIRNERPVYVLLTEDQRIEFRLQRERSTIGIPIADLYDDLNGPGGGLDPEAFQLPEIKPQAVPTPKLEATRAPVPGNIAKFIQSVKDQLHIDGRLTLEETIKLNTIFTEITTGN